MTCCNLSAPSANGQRLHAEGVEKLTKGMMMNMGVVIAPTM